MASKKTNPALGPVRSNLEAFGVAILAAVLLKWFCLEAYQIPTSSMQPTLMGSTEAEVYDRIIVDKLLPTVREPQRWDATVFHYPLQKNQNYVKRIGGIGGDRLRIAGGNLYQVSDDNGQRSYRIIRKPDDLQRHMWKNVYPARREVRSEPKAMPESLGGVPDRSFSEDATGFAVDLDGQARLYLRDEKDGGMVDRVWDGYPTATARLIREKNTPDRPQEIVPDARLTATVTAPSTLDELAFEIEVLRPGLDKLTFALVARGGKARLQVRSKDTKVELESPEFACELPAGTPVEIAFAHVDDRLIAWRGGDELQRLDTDGFACRDGCALPFTGRFELPANQRVTPLLAMKGKGKLRLTDIRIDRDQHYVQDGAPDVIEVPEGYFYMLGDNTLQSIDSRGWTAFEIGVDKDDNVVPPDTGVRNIRGNKRPMPLDREPDRDETPIPIPSAGAIVMIDENGEILRLKGRMGSAWPGLSFKKIGSDDVQDEWQPRETTNSKGISFVPRSDIQGRALLVFYPFRPLSWLTGSAWPDRFGFVR